MRADEVVEDGGPAKEVEGCCERQVADEEVTGGRGVSVAWRVVGGQEWPSKWPKGMGSERRR